MIDSIRIKNIQSHKDTELDFCPGINVIVGSSNNGKTAVLRALYWSIYNRPLGIDTLCSHWALDEKGNIRDEMSVEVKKGNDTLIRRKTKTANQYILNGDELNAIKTDVPPAVNDFYKLNETNIQRQQDAPFLVSSSSGEVAKYFNGIARLDVIDRILSYAEQTKRKERNNIESLENRIEEVDKLHESFSWIEDATPLFDKLDRLSAKKDELNKTTANLEETLNRYSLYDERIQFYAPIIRCVELLDEFDKMQTEEEKLEREYAKLSDELEKFRKLSEINKISDIIKKPLEILKDYDEIQKSINELDNEMNEIQDSMEEVRRYTDKIELDSERAERFKAQLPDICPLCGNPMKEEI